MAEPIPPLVSASTSEESEEDDNDDFASQYFAPSSSSSEGSSASENNATTNNGHTRLARPPFSHPPSQFFAPPFYNRPPTPLPPSPSLTSLLRPSRPTTPDSSSSELDPALRRAHAPRASPKVPTYEYYGFVLYLFSSLAFLMYLLWSYLPSPFLHQLGIYYYPNRWWSLAIPAWLVVLIMWIYVALASYNTGYLTKDLTALENIVDDVANVAVVDSEGKMIRKATRDHLKGGNSQQGKVKRHSIPAKEKITVQDVETWKWREIWSVGTDAVMDVPLGGVCEVLYGAGRESDDEDELEHI